MTRGKRQDTNTGSGSNGNPILASGDGLDHTAGDLILSRQSSEIGQGSTKPVSLPEALGLLQTLCLDLRSLGCKVAILAVDNRLYVRIIPSASIGKLSYRDDHIRLDGLPVSDLP